MTDSDFFLDDEDASLLAEKLADSSTESFGFDVDSIDALNTIISQKPPFVYAICGPWGSGKSTFLKYLVKQLHNNIDNTIIVYFNAWRESQNRNINNALVACIVNRLKIAGVLLLSDSERSLLNSALDILAASFIDMVKASDNVFVRFFKSLYSHSKDTHMVDSPYQTEAEQVEMENRVYISFNNISNILNNKGLIVHVIIDEIDRCPPASVVSVFESLRVFFTGPDEIDILIDNMNDELEINSGAPPFRYIISMDEDYVSRAFMYAYELSRREAFMYLSKYIQHKYHLPIKTWDKYVGMIFAKYYHNVMGLDKEHINMIVVNISNILERSIIVSPREARLSISYLLIWIRRYGSRILDSDLVQKQITNSADNKQNASVIFIAYMFILAYIKIIYPDYFLQYRDKDLAIKAINELQRIKGGDHKTIDSSKYCVTKDNKRSEESGTVSEEGELRILYATITKNLEKFRVDTPEAIKIAMEMMIEMHRN